MANKYVQLNDGSDNIYPRPFWTGTLTNADDLDNVRGYGVFCWCNNVKNKPSDSSTYGYLFSPASNDFQMYFPFGASGCPAIYVRYFTNNQWYSWRKATLSTI